MTIVRETIEFIFGTALFINALLFIPQSIRILKERTAKGVSLFTFLGLLLIQLAIVLHGIIIHDYLLIWGYLVSMATTGTVVALILRYRKSENTHNVNNLDLNEILEQLPGHIYWKDENCVFIGCNSNNRNDFGIKESKDFKGKTDYDIFPKHEADQLRIIDEEVIRTGKPKITEEWSTKSNGEKSLYLSHKVPLKNSKGNIVGMLGVSIDVTKSHQDTIDKLDMLENVIGVMPNTVYWMNKNGVYLGCNDNEAKAIGLSSRKEIVGRKNTDLPGFLIPESLDPVNQKVMETGKPITLEEPATLPDGTKGTFISSKVPIKNNRDDVVGMVGISIDITDRKKQEEELKLAKEEAEKSNKIKSDFISNMQHDIRTPLSGIYGIAFAIKQSSKDPQIKEFAEHIETASTELINFCNTILDFSSITGGSYPVAAKKFNIHDLITDIINMNTPVAKQKKIDLFTTFLHNKHDIIIGDDFRVKRILINLIGNALKFTQKGHVELKIKEIPVKNKKRSTMLQFTVQDTGIGMPKDKQKVIFEKFTKLDPSNRGKYKGTGLGLSIVKEFIFDLDGDIEVISGANAGTTIVCTIPFKLPLVDEMLKGDNNERKHKQ